MKLFNFIVIFFLALVRTNATSTNLKPTASFRSPKNIAFASSGGGSSHHIWVFEILKDMHSRGHNISFFSRGDQLRFAEGYPVKTIKEVGGAFDLLHHPTLVLKYVPFHPHPEVVGTGILQSGMLNYPVEFYEYQSLFKSEKIDLVICDFFSVSCLDAAIISKIPVIATTTISVFEDSSAKYINNRLYTFLYPTSEYTSVWERTVRDFVRIPMIKRHLLKHTAHATDLQRKNGLAPSFEAGDSRYNHIPKFINNIFGIELARKHSPLSHMIGPIMRGSYPSLDRTTAEFLNSHKKIAYIAFGQHCDPHKDDVKMFLQTLFTMMEQRIIDGVVWARINESYLPQSIETPNRVYTFDDIANHKDLYLVKWAPQYGILEHSSTSFFISHGGAGSLHEALYNGVRLFIFPFFGDQPLNARAVEKTGIGLYMDNTKLKYDAKDYAEFYKKLSMIAVDSENKFQEAINRYRAYVQISASNAVTRGSDLMEESLFASDSDGDLKYRYDVGYNIHWIKRNDIDIYALLFVLCLGTVKTIHLVYCLIVVKYTKLQKRKTS